MMEGVIQNDGYVLGDDNKKYAPDMIFGDTILLVCHSWSRVSIKDVVGKRVIFVIHPITKHAYNFDLL